MMTLLQFIIFLQFCKITAGLLDTFRLHYCSLLILLLVTPYKMIPKKPLAEFYNRLCKRSCNDKPAIKENDYSLPMALISTIWAHAENGVE